MGAINWVEYTWYHVKCPFLPLLKMKCTFQNIAILFCTFLTIIQYLFNVYSNYEKYDDVPYLISTDLNVCRLPLPSIMYIDFGCYKRKRSYYKGNMTTVPCLTIPLQCQISGYSYLLFLPLWCYYDLESQLCRCLAFQAVNTPVYWSSPPFYRLEGNLLYIVSHMLRYSLFVIR